MCSNYETQLQMVQRNVSQLESQKKLVQSAADRYREDLSKETEYRKEMENKWSERKEEHKKHVERLTLEVTQTEQAMQQIRQAFDLARSMLDSRFSALAAEHTKVYNSLVELVFNSQPTVQFFTKKIFLTVGFKLRTRDSLENTAKKQRSCKTNALTYQTQLR